MTKEQLMEILWNDFKNDAKTVIDKYIRGLEMDEDCTDWGGCFTAIPNGVTYQDIKNIIDND